MLGAMQMHSRAPLCLHLTVCGPRQHEPRKDINQGTSQAK